MRSKTRRASPRHPQTKDDPFFWSGNRVPNSEFKGSRIIITKLLLTINIVFSVKYNCFFDVVDASSMQNGSETFEKWRHFHKKGNT